MPRSPPPRPPNLRPPPRLSGPQCFEGMKAYRGVNGGVRLFRPDLNIQRLNKSLARLRFPVVDEAAMIELIRCGAAPVVKCVEL